MSVVTPSKWETRNPYTQEIPNTRLIMNSIGNFVDGVQKHMIPSSEKVLVSQSSAQAGASYHHVEHTPASSPSEEFEDLFERKQDEEPVEEEAEGEDVPPVLTTGSTGGTAASGPADAYAVVPAGPTDSDAVAPADPTDADVDATAASGPTGLDATAASGPTGLDATAASGPTGGTAASGPTGLEASTASGATGLAEDYTGPAPGFVDMDGDRTIPGMPLPSTQM